MIDNFKFTKTRPSAIDMHVELSGQIFAVARIDAVFGNSTAQEVALTRALRT